jgi:NO-binding membrane sensor protein with MHYT domain
MFGAGVGAMHYSGMAAMRMDAVLHSGFASVLLKFSLALANIRPLSLALSWVAQSPGCTIRQ